jgi:hypothetical protein
VAQALHKLDDTGVQWRYLLVEDQRDYRLQAQAALAALRLGDKIGDGLVAIDVAGVDSAFAENDKKERQHIRCRAAEATREACLAELAKSSGRTGVAAAKNAIAALDLTKIVEAEK